MSSRKIIKVSWRFVIVYTYVPSILTYVIFSRYVKGHVIHFAGECGGLTLSTCVHCCPGISYIVLVLGLIKGR